MTSSSDRIRFRRGNRIFGHLIGTHVVVLLGLYGSCTAADEKPPNVVLIISDDQMWTDFSFMGHPIVRTPHLDELAAQSLLFTHGYVPTSLCRPSLATIITGHYAHEHKITSNDPPLPPGVDVRQSAKIRTPEYLEQRQEMIDYIDKVPTLPRLLAQQGYLSLQTGKWWEGHYSRGGFTHGMTLGDPAAGGRHGDEGLTIGREGMAPIFRFIDEAGNRPFFVWYAPFLPHFPHTPPQRILDKYKDKTDSAYVARYWAMCEWFDETCGQLLDYLEQKGLSENTLVLFVTDNGWAQDSKSWEHAPRSKLSPYEGGTRTPILVRWPGRIKPARIDTPVLSIDLAPTVLVAAGLEPPSEMPGVNLMDRPAVEQRKAIFGEIFLHNAVDIDKPETSLLYRWSIERPWKVIVPHRPNVPDGEIELYNLWNDPHETINLAGDYPERVARMRRLIDDWWAGPSNTE